MKKLMVAVIIGLFFATPALAYPPNHTPSSITFYSEGRKNSFDQYDEKDKDKLSTYNEKKKEDFNDYDKSEKDKTFVDSKERNDKDPEFDLYDKPQEKTFEKRQRFRR